VKSLNGLKKLLPCNSGTQNKQILFSFIALEGKSAVKVFISCEDNPDFSSSEEFCDSSSLPEGEMLQLTQTGLKQCLQ
jgi:hypothetical protein